MWAFRVPCCIVLKPEVTTVRINPVVMKKALELADGDPTRLKLSRDGTVVVKNHGYQPKPWT